MSQVSIVFSSTRDRQSKSTEKLTMIPILTARASSTSTWFPGPDNQKRVLCGRFEKKICRNQVNAADHSSKLVTNYWTEVDNKIVPLFFTVQTLFLVTFGGSLS